MLSACAEFAASNGFCFNSHKSKCMAVGARCPDFKLGGDALESVSAFKYLGVLWDGTSFAGHKEQRLSAARRKVSQNVAFLDGRRYRFFASRQSSSCGGRS